MSNILAYLPAVICVIAAAGLAFKDQGGWGWFLLVALLIAGAAGAK